MSADPAQNDMEATILISAERCPFCTFDRLWIWDKGVPGKFAVCCSNPACASTGPMSNSVVEAVFNWNRAQRKMRPPLVPNAALARTLDELHKPRRGVDNE